MAKEIEWSDEAITTFNNIIGHIESQWGEKPARGFIEKADNVIKQISVYPYMFRKYNKHNLRQALITKQTLLFYKIYSAHIDLITFWDTRQNPGKRKIS